MLKRASVNTFGICCKCLHIKFSIGMRSLMRLTSPEQRSSIMRCAFGQPRARLSIFILSIHQFLIEGLMCSRKRSTGIRYTKWAPRINNSRDHLLNIESRDLFVIRNGADEDTEDRDHLTSEIWMPTRPLVIRSQIQTNKRLFWLLKWSCKCMVAEA